MWTRYRQVRCRVSTFLFSGWHTKCKASPQARALARALQALCTSRASLCKSIFSCFSRKASALLALLRSSLSRPNLPDSLIIPKGIHGMIYASTLHYTCQHKTTIRDHTLYIWSYIVTIGWHGKCKASPQARALARALQAYCKRRAILASARRATDRLRMGRARNMPSAKPHRITG
jgi:hypothetical protein